VPSEIFKLPITDVVSNITSGIEAPINSNVDTFDDIFNTSKLDVVKVTLAPIVLAVRLLIELLIISRLVILVPVTSNIT
jgi:hypothetical protein